MFLFNKKEVYMGYSIEEVSKVINILIENNIEYEKKLINLLRSDERFTLRRVGVNMNYNTQYIIYVKKCDYEKAEYIINKFLHS